MHRMSEEDGCDGSSYNEAAKYVHVIVGGQCFSLAVEDILRHPDCYFAGMIKKAWRADTNQTISIDRSGVLFRYIADFLFYGILPIGRKQIDLNLMQLIKTEADYYNLHELVVYCESFCVNQLTSLIHAAPSPRVLCSYESSEPTDLINVVSMVWSPFSLKGFADPSRHKLLYKNSTPFDPVVSELLSGSLLCGERQKTQCFEVDGSLLNPDTVAKRIGHFHLCPRRLLELKVSKLVMYTEGGRCDPHRCSVHSDGQIGTLIYVLNTPFTGGTITASQNEFVVSIAEPREWLAFQTNSTLSVDTVTSGTLVYIEFEVYCTGIAKLNDCWTSFGEMLTPLPGHHYALTHNLQKDILTRILTQSEMYENIVIALPSLYPLLNADPESLKDGDLALCTILLQAGFEVDIVTLVVQTNVHHKLITIDTSYVLGYGECTSNDNSVIEEPTRSPDSTVDNSSTTSEIIDTNMKIYVPIVSPNTWSLVTHECVLQTTKLSRNVYRDVYLTTGLRVSRSTGILSCEDV